MKTTSQDQARLYRTARFGNDALAMRPDLPKVRVRIEYFNETYNVYHSRNEALFLCYAEEGTLSEFFLGHWFENALTDFKQ